MTMSRKPDPKSRLIAELFHDDWVNGSTSRLALEAASHVRRRRSLRRAFMAAALTPCALYVAFLVARFGDLSGVKAIAQAPPERAVGAPAGPGHKGYEIISDDELIADLRDRPLLVLGSLETGRQLVLIQPVHVRRLRQSD